MTVIKENINTIVICLCEILVGVLLLINPIGFTSGIIIMLGIVLLISGIISVIGYFRTDAAIAVHEQGLAKGLISSALGLFCILQTHWFIVAFPILTFLYGAAILVLGLFKIQFTSDMIRMKKKRWGFAALSALLNILLAVIIFMNPFGSTIALWTVMAVTLIFEAVFELVMVFVAGK
ncbi:MAG: DUF308 domain-containing protein [Lachnospiraceae bacterium]